jgi:thioester reductase-like protein
MEPPKNRIKENTDVEGMQMMFERYTEHLPQSRETTLASNSAKVVAVIGTTGLLGPHIVASLLSTHKHCSVLCLNRGSDGQQRTELALQSHMVDFSAQSSRLHFFVADMTQPNFGLPSSQADSIASQIDELIFNAWDLHWRKELTYFEPFLKGIRNAIDFCASASRRPRIIFVSTICAVGDWPLLHCEDPAIPEAVVWDNWSAMPHGYGESKCVAEQVLAKAHEVSGVPVSVIRAGQIGGLSRADRGSWPRQGWLYSVIRFSHKGNMFPTHVLPLDWIPVDSFANSIANVSMRPSDSTKVEVFNALHPNPAPWDLLYRTLRSDFKFQAKEISLPDWLKQFDPKHMKLHSLLTALGSGREVDMTFENQNALTVLPSVPDITKELLSGWLGSWDLRLGDLSAKL